MAGRYAMPGAERIQSSTKVPIFTTGKLDILLGQDVWRMLHLFLTPMR